MKLVLHLENGGEQRPVTGERFTIGRAQENDWVLPDPEQHLSRQHCVIERRGAAWCVVDTSANGVFVNGETSPLGRGQERGLGHGDRLQLGSYVIAVAIEGVAGAGAGPGARQDVRPDPRAQGGGQGGCRARVRPYLGRQPRGAGRGGPSCERDGAIARSALSDAARASARGSWQDLA